MSSYKKLFTLILLLACFATDHTSLANAADNNSQRQPNAAYFAYTEHQILSYLNIAKDIKNNEDKTKEEILNAIDAYTIERIAEDQLTYRYKDQKSIHAQALRYVFDEKPELLYDAIKNMCAYPTSLNHIQTLIEVIGAPFDLEKKYTIDNSSFTLKEQLQKLSVAYDCVRNGKENWRQNQDCMNIKTFLDFIKQKKSSQEIHEN